LISTTKVLRDIPSGLNINIRIHLTQCSSALSSGSESPLDLTSGEISEKQALFGLSYTTVVLGRPDIHTTLKEEVEATHGGRIAVAGASCSNSLWFGTSGLSAACSVRLRFDGPCDPVCAWSRCLWASRMLYGYIAQLLNV